MGQPDAVDAFDYSATRTKNKMWFSPPFDGDFSTLGALANSLGTTGEIVLVAHWRQATQAVGSVTLTAGVWGGAAMSEAILPGDGYYANMAIQDYTWNHDPVLP